MVESITEVDRLLVQARAELQDRDGQIEVLQQALLEQQAKVAELERERDEIRTASSMSIASCEHGAVFYRLHDASGKIFAAAIVPMVTALDVNERVLEAIEAIQEMHGKAETDTIGECAGHG